MPKFKMLYSLQNYLMEVIICPKHNHHHRFYTGLNLLLCVAKLKVKQTIMTDSNLTMSENSVAGVSVPSQT